MNNTQSIEDKRLNSFWSVIPKTALALIAALVVPTLAFFILVLLIFGLILAYSVVFEHQVIRISELVDTIGVIFGVAIFATAYLCPGIVVCAGSLGVPVAIIGWRLKLIQKRTSVIVGFILGVVCGILFEIIVYSGSSRSANGITYMIDGSRTFYGWIEFGIAVVVVGLLGVLGGYSFWFVWDRLTPKTIGEVSL